MSTSCSNCRLPGTCHRLAILGRGANHNHPARAVLETYVHARNIRVCVSEDVYPAKDSEGLSEVVDNLESLRAGGGLADRCAAELAVIADKCRELLRVVEEWGRERPKSKTRWISAVEVMAASDHVFYRCYYLQTTGFCSDLESIPAPHEYFGLSGIAWDCVRAGKDAQDRFEHSLPEYFEFESSSLTDNPLLALHVMRWRETAHLFSNNRMNEEEISEWIDEHVDFRAVSSTHDTPCWAPLKGWRDTCRDLPASLYAFATPSPDALEAIVDSVDTKKIVEIGAGTGYWAHQLSLRGLSVAAFDSHPPLNATNTKRTGGGANAYHGYSRAFHSVTKGSFEKLQGVKDSALLLCYPPPNDQLAEKCLAAYEGDRVVYVGEWGGLTATRTFEQMLTTEFTLMQMVELPSWGTDASLTTIWKRRKGVSKAPTDGTLPPCHFPNCKNSGRFRCWFVRTVCYCSEEHFELDAEARVQPFAFQMLGDEFANALSWGSKYFEELDSGADRRGKKRIGANLESAEHSTTKKSRKHSKK